MNYNIPTCISLWLVDFFLPTMNWTENYRKTANVGRVLRNLSYLMAWNLMRNKIWTIFWRKNWWLKSNWEVLPKSVCKRVDRNWQKWWIKLKFGKWFYLSDLEQKISMHLYLTVGLLEREEQARIRISREERSKGSKASVSYETKKSKNWRKRSGINSESEYMSTGEEKQVEATITWTRGRQKEWKV